MTTMRFAAVLHDGHGSCDTLMQQIVKGLKSGPLTVRGLQTWRGKDPNGRLPMLIQDVDTGHIYPISQALGSGSQSCSLNPAALADASIVLRSALIEKPDLVIVNRFGNMEAKGKGFAAEMLAIMAENIPVLTAVSHQYREQWLEFTGDAGGLLPLNSRDVMHWANQLTVEAGVPTS